MTKPLNICQNKLQTWHKLDKSLIWYRKNFIPVNPIQDGPSRGCSRISGSKKSTSLKSVAHILQWWNLVQLCFTLRKSKKIYKSRDAPLEFCWHQHFFNENQQLCQIKRYGYKFHFDTQFLLLLTFLEFLKVALINAVKILMMSAKSAILK